MRRQLWTVDGGVSAKRDTAVVPPRASMMRSAATFMQGYLRQSQTQCKGICENRDCDFRSVPQNGVMETADIKAELLRRGMSQRDLAEAIGMDENHLSKALNGKRQFKIGEMDAIRAELHTEPEDEDHLPIRSIPLLGEVPAGSYQALINDAAGE